ncbi:hypothetical protein D3C72_1512410 [compost metagenome]
MSTDRKGWFGYVVSVVVQARQEELFCQVDFSYRVRGHDEAEGTLCVFEEPSYRKAFGIG